VKKICVLSVALAVAGIGPAYAAGKGDPDKVICKREVPTGSIMAGKKICRTRAQWVKIQQGNEESKRRSMDDAGRALGPVSSD
jgi:hypothetical protein